jgi:hydrogenase maturation protein HypF
MHSEQRRRHGFVVRGVVQGVGFRPFVYAVAKRLELAGFVRNDAGTVVIEVEGCALALDAFARELPAKAPALARISGIDVRELVPCGPGGPGGEDGFHIIASADPQAMAIVSLPADTATCDDCVAELFDPKDRRFGHPFVNCTSCGPRLTIIDGVPYDRSRTTMAQFAMCNACEREYTDPANRRHHAQPIACPACGPRLERSVAEICAALAAGQILALKGLGGYHLACAADDDRVVAELRRRKRRDRKPFAVLVADIAAAARIAHVDDVAAGVLGSPARPIVLVEGTGIGVAPSVAPGTHLLGIMLPYTPLHHLVARGFARPIVLTSGNVTDEPIAFADQDARERLAAIADVFAGHDRAIYVGCDDSVVRIVAGTPTWIRRSRGVAPQPIRLPTPLAQPTLAVGGHLKAVFALGVDATATASHHLGDQDDLAANRAFAAMVTHYERLLQLAPVRIVHDLHPDYATTRYAETRGIPRIAIQHHRAHFASCLADAGVTGPAIGVVLDGAGLGDDGEIWGGEVFVGTAAEARRVAHLGYVALPGGAAAIREPWRMAVSHLVHAGLPPDACGLATIIERDRLRAVARLVRDGTSARTSSVGRLFDAVAALVLGAVVNRHEAEAAMQLEAVTRGQGDLSDRSAGNNHESCYPFDVGDPGPLVRAIAAEVSAGVPPAVISSRFHASLAEGFAEACARIAETTGIRRVALSGGVLVNDRLCRELVARLSARGLAAIRHTQVPPNDGGLALGQLAVIAARDEV